ncbi:MAG: Integrase core domain protein [Synergistetes bacterium ADurb.Bin155]|nr:MAG: Integrase core domain protein [Synergistetes bacterium ADurb.Bin155]
MIRTLHGRDSYPVSLLCLVMGVNRSGYMKWAGRRGVPTASELKRDACVALIKEAREGHKTHGYRWIRERILRLFGVVYSPGYVLKCWRWAGLKANAHGVKYRRPREESLEFPNLVAGDWRPSRPLETVASDMTMLRHCSGRAYELTLYVDAFSREIVSWAMSATPGDRRTYFDGLRGLVRRMKKEQSGLVTTLHTDQGAVYSSRSYNELLKKYSIRHSMSRKGTPTDNPMDESLNGWIKDELYGDFGFYRCEDPIACVRRYVRYYNGERMACCLNYKTPAEYLAQSGL